MGEGSTTQLTDRLHFSSGNLRKAKFLQFFWKCYPNFKKMFSQKLKVSRGWFWASWKEEGLLFFFASWRHVPLT